MVRVEGLRKSYGAVEAVRGVSLEVKRGQVVVLIGPSGCGKSTFLRCINLLEEPSAGTLQVELPDWFAAGLGLTLYMGAFATEIFRGGIISIDKGQWQASRALGMTWPEMMRYIILPQATKRMIPPFVNQSIIQLKNTSLLYVVAVPDLMYTGSIVVADTFRPLEVYTSVALAYFAILYPLTLWAARLEARVDQ